MLLPGCRHKEPGRADRIDASVCDSLALCVCWVLFLNGGRGRRRVCVFTRFPSSLAGPDVSREIAAVLKLLLLEDLRDKMVCNSQPVLPLCSPCCCRCFHTAPAWLYEDKRLGGAFCPHPRLRFQRRFAGSEDEASPLGGAFLILRLLYARHVSLLFFHSALALAPSNGTLGQYAVPPRSGANEADEYSRGGGHVSADTRGLGC